MRATVHTGVDTRQQFAEHVFTVREVHVLGIYDEHGRTIVIGLNSSA